MKCKFAIIILFCLTSSNGCRTVYNADFPLIRIENSYDLYLTSNTDLLSICGAVVDTIVGYKGIVVFRQAYEGLPNDFIAFDLACTSDSCHYRNKIKVESFNIFAECPVCHTKYDLMNYGWSVIEDKSSKNKAFILQRYDTYFSGRYVTVKN